MVKGRCDAPSGMMAKYPEAGPVYWTLRKGEEEKEMRMSFILFQLSTMKPILRYWILFNIDSGVENNLLTFGRGIAYDPLSLFVCLSKNPLGRGTQFPACQTKRIKCFCRHHHPRMAIQ